MREGTFKGHPVQPPRAPSNLSWMFPRNPMEEFVPIYHWRNNSWMQGREVESVPWVKATEFSAQLLRQVVGEGSWGGLAVWEWLDEGSGMVESSCILSGPGQNTRWQNGFCWCNGVWVLERNKGNELTKVFWEQTGQELLPNQLCPRSATLSMESSPEVATGSEWKNENHLLIYTKVNKADPSTGLVWQDFKINEHRPKNNLTQKATKKICGSSFNFN